MRIKFSCYHVFYLAISLNRTFLPSLFTLKILFQILMNAILTLAEMEPHVWMVLTHFGASAFQVMLVPCVNKVRANIAFYIIVCDERYWR